MKDQPASSYATRVELAKTIGKACPDDGRYMIDICVNGERHRLRDRHLGGVSPDVIETASNRGLQVSIRPGQLQTVPRASGKPGVVHLAMTCERSRGESL